jgi:hypothetical protein
MAITSRNETAPVRGTRSRHKQRWLNPCLGRRLALVKSALPVRPVCREEAGVTYEQQLVERGAPGARQADALKAARESLKTQIARLERELSSVVAERFPYIPAPTYADTGVDARADALLGPRLLDLGELERSRDELAGRVQELRAVAARRAEHERQAHEQLERMRLEPGRYRFVRLPVNDLGQGGCGVWEVRPRLGLIGMLAGWWELTLSSGCPLAKGSRSTRDPAQPS